MENSASNFPKTRIHPPENCLLIIHTLTQKMPRVKSFKNPETSEIKLFGEKRLPIKVSLKKSAWFAFLVTVLAGGLIEVGCLLFIYFLMKTIFIYDWKKLHDPFLLSRKKAISYNWRIVPGFTSLSLAATDVAFCVQMASYQRS